MIVRTMRVALPGLDRRRARHLRAWSAAHGQSLHRWRDCVRRVLPRRTWLKWFGPSRRLSRRIRSNESSILCVPLREPLRPLRFKALSFARSCELGRGLLTAEDEEVLAEDAESTRFPLRAYC